MDVKNLQEIEKYNPYLNTAQSSGLHSWQPEGETKVWAIATAPFLGTSHEIPNSAGVAVFGMTVQGSNPHKGLQVFLRLNSSSILGN